MPIKLSTRIVTTLKAWLPLAVLATLVAVLVYGANQQSYRQNANDPQIEIAQDTARSIQDSGQADGIVPVESVDIRQSLSPYIMTFNNDGQLLASSALLDGSHPLPPAGVFAYAKAHGQERFSWQPAAGVRSAAVLIHYEGSQPGFVLVGRSLREIELRENRLALEVLIAWMVMLSATLGTVYITQK